MPLDNLKLPASTGVLSSKRKLAAALGLILGTTSMAVTEVGCGLDVRGTGEFAGSGGQGGEGGTDAGVGTDAIFPMEDAADLDTGSFPDAKDADAGVDAAVDASSDADAGMDAAVDASSDADAGMDAAVDASSDADAGMDAAVDAGSDVDAGMDAAVDASPDADAEVDAGCLDIPVTFNNMSGYVFRVFRGSCNEADVVYSSYMNGALTFGSTAEELCLKSGDVVVAQVKDAADKNSAEFLSSSVPTLVKVLDLSATQPITYNLMRSYCSSVSGWTTIDAVSSDKNPAVGAYKYEGTTDIDGGATQSSGFYIKY